MPLALWQQVVLQYLEPVACLAACYMAFFTPIQFLCAVFYLPEDAKPAVAKDPLVLMLIKYAGGITAIFAAALYSICASQNDAVIGPFFLFMMIPDIYFMVALSRFASRPPGVIGKNFYIGTFVSVLVFAARVTFLLSYYGGSKA